MNHADATNHRSLLLTDLGLVALTVVGCAARWWLWDTPVLHLGAVLGIYVASKIAGWLIADYAAFQRFIDAQVTASQHGAISGFAFFKGVLVALLFAGFVLVDPSFWLVESALVVAMRLWVRKHDACAEGR